MSSASLWESSPSKSGLVSIGTHAMFLTVQGPVREPGDPVVVVEAGMGDGVPGWIEVQKRTSPAARIALYDRSGIGRSETSPLARSGENVARELSALLDAAGIVPPFVIVCHSFGGIYAREFVAARPSDVVGMVLVDAQQERSYVDLPINFEYMFAILGDLDYFKATRLDEENVFSLDEWRAVKEQTKQNEPTAELEQAQADASSDTLGEKKQLEHGVLGGYPVSVIKGYSVRDYRNIYEAGVAAGNGDEKQRAHMRHIISIMDPIEVDMQKAQLKLSTLSKFRETRVSGHNVQLTEPDLIVEEIHWVLDAYKNMRVSSNGHV